MKPPALPKTFRLVATATPGAPASIRTRAEVPERYRWDLTDVFPNDAAFEDAFRQVESLIADVAALRGTLGRSAASLRDALNSRDRAWAEYERLMVYAGLSYHEDMDNKLAQGRDERTESLGTRLSEALSWFTPELLTLDERTVHEWMTADSELSVYRHAIDDVHRLRPHTLPAREEALLAMAGDILAAPGNIYSRFTNTNLDFPMMEDEKGQPVRLSPGRYSAFIYSRDRRVRRAAFDGMHDTYAAKANTLSAMLAGHVKTHIFNAKARGHSNCLAAALAGPNVPVSVYDNLIETVGRHLGTLHRYVAMRKRLMKLDAIHAYDLYVPMVKASEENIPYDEAIDTILEALAPLGDDYLATLREAFASRWIDVYETVNKRSGAYCWGAYLTHPYLLLNYNGTMNDRSTIAHELGHAMHSVYTQRAQPIVYGDYATFCAEVASTVNEVLLAHHLLSRARTDVERLLILQQEIDEIRTTVFRQTCFAEYERTIHEHAEAGKPLTADALCGEYETLIRKYYGPELTIAGNASAECLRIPHFYRNFYVYTYATSHCAATNIGRRILRGEPGVAEGFRKFLSAGSSLYPLDVLKLAGVDMTTPRPIEDTMALFEELLDEFEALYQRAVG